MCLHPNAVIVTRTKQLLVPGALLGATSTIAGNLEY